MIGYFLIEHDPSLLIPHCSVVCHLHVMLSSQNGSVGKEKNKELFLLFNTYIHCIDTQSTPHNFEEAIPYFSSQSKIKRRVILLGYE